jgi:3'-phosphoadenosine 5'-phosphosulfate sulfotransferase (PAPS reductase)/FAD synthetase
MLTVLSFGAGQDSTALLYKYTYDPAFKAKYAPKDFLTVVSDTKDEHDYTYKHIDEIKGFCTAHRLPFAHLTSDLGFHSEKWLGLREFYRRTKSCGSKAFNKSCTDQLKIKPFYRFLTLWVSRMYDIQIDPKSPYKTKSVLVEYASRYGKIKVMIGIAHDEAADRIGSYEPPKWMGLAIEKIYPLVDLGWDRAACQRYIESVGHTVPMPSNCMLCPFMSKQELLWLHRHHPEDFKDWVKIERDKLRKFKRLGDRNLGVWGKKTLLVVLQDAERDFGHMTDEQLTEYKRSHGHCVKSKY